MMRAPLCSILLLMVACAVSGKSAKDLQVTEVRYWTVGDCTRIAIQTNGEFTYKWDRLSNPDRLFFDIVDARPNVDGRRFSTRQVTDKFLKQIRVAETDRGRTRVVLDLNRPVDFNVSQLGNPDRLMIELRAAPVDKTPANVSQGPVGAPAEAPITPQPAVTPAAPATEVAKVTHDVPAPAAPSSPAPEASVRTTAEPASPARRSTADGSRSLIRALGLKINRVVIDAGHGGHDVGTIGPNGMLEKDLVLDVALRLGKLIEQKMGAEVVYTRRDDTFIPLEERTAIANRSHADLFLSIHANSSPVKSVAGVETFYLNFTSAPDALDVAARENASSSKSVFELRDLIQSISLHDKIEESKEFASDVQRSMQTFAAKNFPSAKDRGIKKAPFVVLIGAQMPSVLSEIGFISNPKEESLLKRPEHRQKVAEALYKGLSRYADSLSHVQVSQTVSKPDHDSSAATVSK
jgi:N-acetylmuramoyl-L-alanine amidase